MAKCTVMIVDDKVGVMAVDDNSRSDDCLMTEGEAVKALQNKREDCWMFGGIRTVRLQSGVGWKGKEEGEMVGEAG
jgi:hypothetical protein